MESERRPCGCPLDYHLADCPILTDRYPSGDYDPYELSDQPDDPENWF